MAYVYSSSPSRIHVPRRKSLCFSLMYSKHLEQCSARNSLSVFICWMNKQVNDPIPSHFYRFLFRKWMLTYLELWVYIPYLSLLLSCISCDKLLQTWYLKTTEIHPSHNSGGQKAQISITAPKIQVPAGTFLTEALGKNLVFEFTS